MLRKIVIFLVSFLFFSLMLAFFWDIFHLVSVVIFLFSIIFAIILFSYQNDFSIPILSTWLNRQYFITKYKLFDLLTLYQLKLRKKNYSNNPLIVAEVEHNLKQLKHKKIKIHNWLQTRIIFNTIKLKALYYLILIFKNSEESFVTLREDSQDAYDQLATILDDDYNQVNLKILKERNQQGEKIDERLLNKLMVEYLRIHKTKQRQASKVSMAVIALVILATSINTFLMSVLFPNIFSTKAAVYSWTQTSWSGGTSTAYAIHPGDATTWNKYTSKDTDISIVNGGADLQLNVISTSTTETTQADFNTGTHNGTVATSTGAITLGQ